MLNGFVLSAGAQENINEFLEMSPIELADISVSIATGTAKPLSQSAAVTSVITAEQITEMGATQLHEVLETVPGIHVSIQPVTNDYIYTLRGVRNETNADVLLMLNGTRFTLPYRGTHMSNMLFPVEAIQRIEVIRGPGSALYGADAFAGVINIVTKKASDLNGVTLGSRGGNANSQSAWGQYGGQWHGWDVASSLQYTHSDPDPNRRIRSDLQSQIDGLLSPYHIAPASLAPGSMQTQTASWNGHLNFKREHWDLGFWAFHEGNGGLRAGPAGSLDTNGRVVGSHYQGDVRYSTENTFKNWEWQGHFSFVHGKSDANIYNFPPGAVLPMSQGNINPRSTNLVSFPNGVRVMTAVTSFIPTTELVVLYKGLENHIIKTITSFRHEEVNSTDVRNYGTGVSPGILTNLTGSNLSSLPDVRRSVWSMAFQDEWQFASDWNLTSGVRYDRYSDFGETVNPRFALVWQTNEQLISKLMYGQAFRAPSFMEQYQRNNQLFAGNASLRPETIETNELAFEYRPTRRLRTALNVFYYEIQNLIGADLGLYGTQALTATNYKGQHAYGSEIEMEWKFLEDWSLRGNYAWQQAHNRTNDQRVNNVPQHHVYSALAWHFMPKWQVQTQINWVGSRTHSTGSPELKDYETIDLTLNAKQLMGFLDLTASARNLFDSAGKEPAVSSYPNSLPIVPQSYYFEAAVHF